MQSNHTTNWTMRRNSATLWIFCKNRPAWQRPLTICRSTESSYSPRIPHQVPPNRAAGKLKVDPGNHMTIIHCKIPHHHDPEKRLIYTVWLSPISR
jgi:hypothetical protein